MTTNPPKGAPGGLTSAMRRRCRSVLTWLAASLLAVGCAPRPAERPAPPSPPVAVAPPASAAPRPAAPKLLTLEEYKREVARRIYAASSPHLYEGAPPPMLKSIVVLAITVNAEGQPTHVAVRRSNGYRALERIALQSVRDAAPLPRPGNIAARRGVVEFNETWLFRDDGRFQIRSLAQVQADG